jgi:hypothetical protein
MGLGPIVAAVVLVAGGIGGYAAYETGYLPLNIGGFSTLTVEPPTGNYTVISIEEIKERYPEAVDVLRSIPRINEVKYSFYVTNASIDEVFDAYHNQLIRKGYNLHVTGNVTVGNRTILVLRYHGYVEGWTAVGIVCCQLDRCYVLYTTGFAQIYKDDIVPYLLEKKNEYGF